MPAYLSTTSLGGSEAVDAELRRIRLAGQIRQHEAGAWSQVQRVGQPYVQPEPSPLDAAQWLVFVEGGGGIVGPVSANQIAHAIRAGNVPTDASIQANGEVFWTGLLDEPAVIAALRVDLNLRRRRRRSRSRRKILTCSARRLAWTSGLPSSSARWNRSIARPCSLVARSPMICSSRAEDGLRDEQEPGRPSPRP